MFIVKFQLNPQLWTSPLLILGTQWYILFNCHRRRTSHSQGITFGAKNFHVQRATWWRRIILPAIFPYYITGAITAAGGAWNASIVAEAVSWGGTHLAVSGLGAYIAHYSDLSDYPKLYSAIAIMPVCVSHQSFTLATLYLLAENVLEPQLRICI